MGLATSEKEVIDASNKGGALGPTDMDVSGAFNTRWSSISWSSNRSSKHTAEINEYQKNGISR